MWYIETWDTEEVIAKFEKHSDMQTWISEHAAVNTSYGILLDDEDLTHVTYYYRHE